MPDKNKDSKKSKEQRTKEKHHDWAKGFLFRGKSRIFHPYTRKDFEFGKNTNEL